MRHCGGFSCVIVGIVTGDVLGDVIDDVAAFLVSFCSSWSISLAFFEIWGLSRCNEDL